MAQGRKRIGMAELRPAARGVPSGPATVDPGRLEQLSQLLASVEEPGFDGVLGDADDPGNLLH